MRGTGLVLGLLVGSGLVSNVAAAAPGDPVSSFGGSGTVETAAAFAGVAVQSNGDVVAVKQGNGQLAVYRYLPSGAVDSSFGNGGVFATDFSCGGLSTCGGNGTAVAIQPNGDIMALSLLLNGSQSIGLALVRLLPDGSLDHAFGTNGIFTDYQYPEATGGSSMILSSDGSIFVAGWDATSNSGQRMVVWKVTSSGALDNSFGSNGEYLGPLFYGAGAYAITWAANGDIVIAGVTIVSPSSNVGATVVELTPLGAVVPSFGSAGSLTIYDAQYYGNGAYAIVSRPDGSFLVGDWDDLGGLVFHVTSGGALDTAYGTNGYNRTPSQHSVSQLLAMVLDPQGRLVITGMGPPTNGITGYPWVMTRLNPDGTIDQTFGNNGSVVMALSPNSTSVGWAVAIDPSGNLVVGGSTTASSQNPPGGFLAEVAGGSLPPPPPFAVAFQASNGTLRSEGPAGLTNWNLGMAPGTSPSVMSVGTSGYEIAFQAYGGGLWTVGTAGWTNWNVGMAPGTSPSIVRLSNGGYEIAFQAYGGALWTIGTAGWTSWGVGMAPGTSPSVVALPNGGFEVAFQAYGGALWTVGTAGWTNWNVGMAPGTSPSAFAPSSGGFEAAFQAYGGALWTVGSAGWTNWNVGMAPGTSPATVRLSNGGYELGFQAYGGALWTIGTAGWTNWGVGMAPETSPSMTAISSAGYEIAFQAYGGNLWTIGTAGWTDWPLPIAAATNPTAS